jgi:hypothetical protein
MPNTVSRLNQYACFISNEYDEVSETGIKISGLGTYFSDEFTENVGIGTFLTANVYRPYNILESEFAHVTNTPGLGVYMRHNKSNSVDVYNEIDDYSLLPRYAITPSTTSVQEGNPVYFNVFTSNVSAGTTIYYEVVSPPIVEIYPSTTQVPVTGSIDFVINTYNVGLGTTLYYDFFGVGINTSVFSSQVLSGTFVTDNTNANTITLAISQEYDSYAIKFFQMNVRAGSANGTILNTSPVITIIPNNISVTVSTSSTSFNTGGSVTITATVSGSTSGTLYYRINGDVSNSNFSDGLLYGSFSYTAGTGQITKTVNAATSIINFTVSIETKKSLVLATTQSIRVSPVSSISTYAGFTANAVIGSTINLLGQSGTNRTLSVVAAPNGDKSIRFPVTWPSSSFSFNNQNINYSFTIAAGDFTILSDVDYIFNGGSFGVHPISGNSESCCDPYSMSFGGVSIFSTRGLNSSTYFRVSGFGGVISSNSGNVNYTTDGSANGGNGLTGASGYFYLS